MALAGAAKTYHLKQVVVHLTKPTTASGEPDTGAEGQEAAEAAVCAAVSSFAAALLSGLYEGTIRYRSSKPDSKVVLQSVQLAVSGETGGEALEQAAARGVALARGTLLAQ